MVISQGSSQDTENQRPITPEGSQDYLPEISSTFQSRRRESVPKAEDSFSALRPFATSSTAPQEIDRGLRKRPPTSTLDDDNNDTDRDSDLSPLTPSRSMMGSHPRRRKAPFGPDEESDQPLIEPADGKENNRNGIDNNGMTQNNRRPGIKLKRRPKEEREPPNTAESRGPFAESWQDTLRDSLFSSNHNRARTSSIGLPGELNRTATAGHQNSLARPFHDAKCIDTAVNWKEASVFRSSLGKMTSDANGNTIAINTSKFNIFKKSRKSLANGCETLGRSLSVEQYDWTEKTFGVECRFGEKEHYLNPDQWLYDDFTVEVVTTMDILWAGPLLNLVEESSKLAQENQMIEETERDDDDIDLETYFRNYCAAEGIFHPDIRRESETLLKGSKLRMHFSGLRALMDHYRLCEQMVPYQIIKPSQYSSAHVLSSFNDSLKEVCNLSLRTIDPNFFETGLRLCALSGGDSIQMRKALLKAAEDRILRIMLLVREEARRILADRHLNPNTMGPGLEGHMKPGPIGSTLLLIDKRLNERKGTTTNHRGTKLSRRASVGGINERSRRESVVGSRDDDKEAFIQTLTNSERDFYERYRREVMPDMGSYEFTIFDRMIAHVAEVNDLNPYRLLNLTALEKSHTEFE